MPIRRSGSPDEKVFGAEEPPVPGVETQEPSTNEAEQPGIIDRVVGKVRKLTERDYVTLPDGWTVSAATAALVQDRGMEFLGTEFIDMVTEKAGPGMEREVRYDPSRHGAEELKTKRRIVREYSRLAKADDGFPQLWMVENRKPPRCIGHTASQALLRRIGYEPVPAAQ